jgi:uncharacterized protein
MTYIPRLLEAALTASFSTHKVLLLLGARQVGKTTIIAKVGPTGTPLNMDIEVDRARVIAASKLAPADAVRSLGAKEGSVLVIDEAHRVPDIGRIAKGWYDAKVPVKIVLLGSSSATLLDIAAAELTGRNEKLWLTPLLFSEILQQQAWTSALPAELAGAPTWSELHPLFPDQIATLLQNRLVFGSYPEAYLTDEPEHYLTNLSSDYLLKDIFTESLVRSPDDVRRLLLELAANIGQSLSINQLATRLRLARQTVQRYLDLLTGIFVIFSLPAYYTDGTKEVTKSHKYFFWDNGVKNALQREWVVSPSRSDIEVLWKNWVISEIMKQSQTLRRHEELFFWQSRNGSAVDLVVKQGSTLHAFDMSFKGDLRPSRSFENSYGVAPKTITPQNFLEFLV